MSSAKRVLYWDTSVFLCFLDDAEKARRHICEDILRHAQQGHVTIMTSTFAIVETIRPKWIKPPVALTADQIRILDGMFRWPWISKYQIDERLTLRAVALARDFGLKPGDSIHAATAIAASVDVLQCWDRDFSVIAHLVSVAQPAYLTQQMPLLDVKPAIGPSQQALQQAANGVSASSAAPARPLGQSGSVGAAKAPPPEQVPPLGPPADQEPQPRDSSQTVPPPLRSKQSPAE